METEPNINEYFPREPSLTILLPTYNDGWRLGTQLAGILPQLHEQDQLIVCVQGQRLIADSLYDYYRYNHGEWQFLREPLGLCPAYNHCAAQARGDWILGASGNDEIQPGALAAWRRAAKLWPEAKVMFGHCINVAMKPWLPETGWLPLEWMPPIWLDQGWKTHGAGCFIRRDAWGKGYPLQLGYMADHYQSMMLAFEYGCVYLRNEISRVNFLRGGASQAHFNAVERTKEKAAFVHMVLTQASEVARKRFEEFDRITGFSKGGM